MKTVIARRRYRDLSNRGRPVEVRVGAPRRSGRDWKCAFQVLGLQDDSVEDAFGVDGVQALLQAFEGVRAKLKRSSAHLAWPGGEDGDAGIPAQVPTALGLQFAKQVERYIERQFLVHSRKAHEGELHPRKPNR